MYAKEGEPVPPSCIEGDIHKGRAAGAGQDERLSASLGTTGGDGVVDGGGGDGAKKGQGSGAATGSTVGNAGTPGGSGSVFVSPQALTFPVAVGLIFAAWKCVQVFFPDAAWVLYVPLAASLAVGLAIILPTAMDEAAAEQRPGRRGVIWFRAIIVGILNSLVLCGAVIGGNSVTSGQKKESSAQSPATTKATSGTPGAPGSTSLTGGPAGEPAGPPRSEK